jgi:NCAIR mutase (PurE)-related protein
MSDASLSPDRLLELLQRVATGAVSPADAVSRLEGPDGTYALAAGGEVRVDLGRAKRCRFPEVVYAPGKNAEAIAEVFLRQIAEGQGCLATRVEREQAEVVTRLVPLAVYRPRARTMRIPSDAPPRGRVVVITAGTSDLPVAEEAVETLLWTGTGVELIADCGVAGPQRLLAELPRLKDADAIIVVAGMEGALPSVVGGWVDSPVIAVPTSVGYGASFGGLTALLGMLNSCAANVTVVNIDAGFKAGYLAGLIAQRRVDG